MVRLRPFRRSPAADKTSSGRRPAHRRPGSRAQLLPAGEPTARSGEGCWVSGRGDATTHRGISGDVRAAIAAERRELADLFDTLRTALHGAPGLEDLRKKLARRRGIPAVCDFLDYTDTE